MTNQSTSAAMRKVLGAVTCIVLLAYIAACGGGEGSNDVSLLPSSIAHDPGVR